MAIRSGLKAQVHAVLAKQGVSVRASDMFGVFGRAQLDRLALDAPYRARVDSLLRLIDAFDFEVDAVGARLRAQLAGEPGYQALLSVPGVGPVLAGIFYAEIGDVQRFPTARHLCSWAGLTPLRVGYHGAPRVDHQARIEAGAVGGDRSGAETGH